MLVIYLEMAWATDIYLVTNKLLVILLGKNTATKKLIMGKFDYNCIRLSTRKKL